jgi:hypothetical protein
MNAKFATFLPITKQMGISIEQTAKMERKVLARRIQSGTRLEYGFEKKILGYT